MLGARGSGQPTSSADSEPDIELPVLDAEPKASPATPPPQPRASSSGSLHAPWRLRQGQASGEGGAGRNNGIGARGCRFFIRNWERLLLLVAIVVLVVLISVKGLAVFGDILRWFQRQDSWAGWACFLALYCANVALFLPGVVLILGGGFVFGFWRGVLAVWLGGGVGQALAFLLARYLVQDSVSVLVKGRWRKWEIIDRAIEQEGWKLLVLLRLSPIVPYNLLNITMAATKIRFWPFALASFFGIIPECSLLTYMGSLATDLTQIISGEAGPKGAVTYALAGVTLLLLVGSATWATLFVRRAMRRAEAQLRGEEGDSEAGEPLDSGNASQHGLEQHLLLEDYCSIPRSRGGTGSAPSCRRRSSDEAPSGVLGMPPLLQTAALLAIPGLGSPRAPAPPRGISREASLEL